MRKREMAKKFHKKDRKISERALNVGIGQRKGVSKLRKKSLVTKGINVLM
jgi:hypothetical protein